MKTREDGWDCVPEFKEAVDCIDSISDCIYEISHCERKSSTADLKEEMIRHLKDAIRFLEYIDEDIEYETIYDDED
tara:strand:+ start:146 stop:373 length:228 start_codon:yes stop_codon:yes gene_type:complete